MAIEKILLVFVLVLWLIMVLLPQEMQKPLPSVMAMYALMQPIRDFMMLAMPLAIYLIVR